MIAGAYTTWLHGSGSGETVLEAGLGTRSGSTTGFWAAYPAETGKIEVSGDDINFYWNNVLIRTSAGEAAGKTFYGQVAVYQTDAIAYITGVQYTSR